MNADDVASVELSRLRPGCPPEHFRERLRQIESPEEIKELLPKLVAADPAANAPSAASEGGIVSEYLVKFKDGNIKRILLRGDSSLS